MFAARPAPGSEAQFHRTLQRLADATGRPIEEVLRQQGRLLARDLAFHIHPRGLQSGLGRAFQDSIRAKILALYKPIGWMHEHIERTHGTPAADHLTKLIRTGKFTQARALLEGRLRLPITPLFVAVGRFDGGELHRRWRWAGRRRLPVMIVPDFPAVRRYLRETVARAGTAKAALINAGRQLDGKTTGVPAWIKRHTTAPGTGRLLRQRSQISGYIESRLRYAREALPPSDERRALQVRSQTAARQLQRIVDHNIRRAMRGA